MTDSFVPAQVIADRFERLRRVVERSALVLHRARVGQVEGVVVEGPSKRDRSVVTGRTTQNKLVHFRPVAGSVLPAGAYADLRITDAAPHHLSGELLAVTAPPSHRVRIPVAAG
jgi:tRNA-2-methylthio-N6-dimethylallyladenosine synthase